MASIIFHRSLYAPEAVQAAAAAYADLARIVLHAHDNDVVAEIDGVDERVPDVVDAFCNHALYESIVRRQAEAGQ